MRSVSALTALLLWASIAAAEPESSAMFAPRATVYLSGGMSAPLKPSEFKDTWSLGWNFGGGIGYHATGLTEIRALVHYSAFGLDTMGIQGISGGTFSVLETTGELKLFPTGRREGDPLALYLVGGIGVGRVKLEEATFPGLGTIGGVTETKLASAFGLGFDIQISQGDGLFLEVKYVNVSTIEESTGYLPVRAGMRLEIGG